MTAETNGSGNRFLSTGLPAIGGLLVGLITMVAFLYGQFFTLREHEEFRKTIAETQFRNEDRFKRAEENIIANQKSLAEIQGFIQAHKAPAK